MEKDRSVEIMHTPAYDIRCWVYKLLNRWHFKNSFKINFVET